MRLSWPVSLLECRASGRKIRGHNDKTSSLGVSTTAAVDIFLRIAITTFTQDQDQRSEPEVESRVQSTSDDVLHAVSIPAYKTHRWKKTVVLLT